MDDVNRIRARPADIARHRAGGGKRGPSEDAERPLRFCRPREAGEESHEETGRDAGECTRDPRGSHAQSSLQSLYVLRLYQSLMEVNALSGTGLSGEEVSYDAALVSAEIKQPARSPPA